MRATRTGTLVGPPLVPRSRCTVLHTRWVNHVRDVQQRSRTDVLQLQLEMKELRALALKYLASQITKENVVAELFTKFTSQWVLMTPEGSASLTLHYADMKRSRM